MQPIIRQVLIVAAGVLIAAAFVGTMRAITPMDWPTALVGAGFLMGCVYVLGAANEDRP
jgi:hypothetical protein